MRGRVAESGTHEELLARNGHLRRPVARADGEATLLV
jgi:ABC-type multidrug transport system fused ATPase/permease subunit